MQILSREKERNFPGRILISIACPFSPKSQHYLNGGKEHSVQCFMCIPAVMLSLQGQKLTIWALALVSNFAVHSTVTTSYQFVRIARYYGTYTLAKSGDFPKAPRPSV